MSTYDMDLLPYQPDLELVTLAKLAGVDADPRVFRILLELMELQVSPEDIYTLLREVCPLSPQGKKEKVATPGSGSGSKHHRSEPSKRMS